MSWNAGLANSLK